MKVAVVGTGSAGRRHLANLLAAGVRDIIAVSEHGRRESLEVEGTPITVRHDLGGVLSHIDAVVIANATSYHLDSLRLAVAASRHVYIEKPAATGAAGIAEIAREASKRKLVVAVGTQFRFNDRLQDLADLLACGELGEILSVRAQMGEHVADYHPGEDYRQSYTVRAELGGGVLLTQIHQVDYLYWLFGPFERVFAVGRTTSLLGIDVEDTVDYLLAARSGAAVNGHLDYLLRPKTVGLEVWGTKGRSAWDYFANTLIVQPASNDAPPRTISSAFDRNAMFKRCLTDFLERVRDGGRPRADLGDALASLAIVDAIKTSMTSGRAVELS